MKHFRFNDTIVMQIPKEELAGWLDTPGLLEIIEENLDTDEQLENFDVEGNDMTTLVLRLNIRRESEPSEAELDRRENGVPLV
jgi:hypothetical protein